MILTMDVGTSFFKVGVIDIKGNILFFNKVKITLDAGELNPYQWEISLIKACSSIPLKYLNIIEVIVVSGNGPTIIPIGSSGKPIADALLWNDTRSLSVSDEIRQKIKQSLPPNFFLSKAYWFYKEHPELYDQTVSFLSCPEYISYLLTGNVFTLLPVEGFSAFYWNSEKITKLGLDPVKFPEFISPFQTYGSYSNFDLIPKIKKNIPVICAGPDFLMSILGSGSIKQGILCDRTGTSEGLNFCSSTPIQVDNFRTLPHLMPGLYTVAGLIPNSGDYVLNNKLDLLIEQYKNILKGLSDAGIIVEEIRIVGGHANIDELNKLKSMCTKVPIKIYAEGSELVGNAILGSVVTGKHPDIKSACKSMVREKFCYNI
ncbi:MAG: FGGY family carbohydrate kinase [Spirochaetaceae bacterium]